MRLSKETEIDSKVYPEKSAGVNDMNNTSDAHRKFQDDCSSMVNVKIESLSIELYSICVRAFLLPFRLKLEFMTEAALKRRGGGVRRYLIGFTLC